jgi:hypothetical protein
MSTPQAPPVRQPVPDSADVPEQASLLPGCDSALTVASQRRRRVSACLQMPVAAWESVELQKA